MIDSTYCIYRHIRLDKNTPFYVGKGHTKRANEKSNRTKYWTNISSKGYEVEIIVEGLTEEEAFKKEIEFIKLYKDLGYCEANFSTGGEGASGVIHTAETRKKMSEDKIRRGVIPPNRKGIKLSKEHCEKIGNIHRGMKHSEEVKKKISDALKGRKQSKEWIENAAATRRGKPRSEETKRKISETEKITKNSIGFTNSFKRGIELC